MQCYSITWLRLMSVIACGLICFAPSVQAQLTPREAEGVVQTGPRSGGLGQPARGGGQPATAPAAAAQPPRPPVELQEDPRLDPILRAWEHYTRNIERLHGNFDRYVYDSTFLVEKRSAGEFWYEAPDKGRLDFTAFPEERMPPPNDKGQRINPQKLGANGAPYTVMRDTNMRWICRGDALLFIHVDEKMYDITEIPPHMQGKAITSSPLPFLFGVSADELRKKFYMSLGTMHDPDGSRTGHKMLHIVAAPRLASLAQEFSRAEVLLDPGTIHKDANGQPVFAPIAIRMFDPTGQQETAYRFDVAKAKLNQRPLFFGNPFREPSLLQGFRLNQHNRVTHQEDPNQRSAEAPGTASQRLLR